MAGNTVLWGALIAGTASLLALAGGKLLEIWIEHRRRLQRGTDLLCALHAEILAGVGASDEQLTPDERRYALSDATPFATPDDTDFVFAEVRGDISVLPQPVIHSVVAYYRKALQSNAMTRDLRDPCFLAQPEGHKRKFVRQLLEIADEQTYAGRAALVELRKAANERGIDLPTSIAGTRPPRTSGAAWASGQGLDGTGHGSSDEPNIVLP
jgi:hypothetical protein